MSYDLNMYAPSGANQHPITIWKQHSFSEIDPQWPEMLNPLLFMQQDRLAGELVDLYPDFEMAISSYSLSDLGSERGRAIELWRANGLQVSLYLESANIVIPYWYNSKYEIDSIFEQIRKCAMLIQNVTGYIVDDPQVGGIVKLPEGMVDMTHAYLYTMGLIAKHIP